MKKSISNDLHNTRNKVYDKAVELLSTGVLIENNPLIQEFGKVETPIPIYDLENRIASWFVGITVRDRIVSFLQFDDNLTFMRYSTFLHKNDSVEGCPKSFTWLKPTYIQKLARAKASPDDKLSAPFMTYDKNPSRIVWAVRASDIHGRIKTILVCGTFVYLNSQKTVESSPHQ
jgi:hypothetical protein